MRQDVSQRQRLEQLYNISSCLLSDWSNKLFLINTKNETQSPLLFLRIFSYERKLDFLFNQSSRKGNRTKQKNKAKDCFISFFFLEHTEKKLEVCINHTAVHDSSCSGNNSICLHTSKVTEISFNMFSTARALVGCFNVT